MQNSKSDSKTEMKQNSTDMFVPKLENLQNSSKHQEIEEDVLAKSIKSEKEIDWFDSLKNIKTELEECGYEDKEITLDQPELIEARNLNQFEQVKLETEVDCAKPESVKNENLSDDEYQDGITNLVSEISYGTNKDIALKTENLVGDKYQDCAVGLLIDISGTSKDVPMNTGIILPFVCRHCDKRFPLKSKLTRHLQYHAEGPRKRSFACSYCDKKFTDNSNLVNHIRTHTGEKPFVCSFCDKKFTFKSNLVIHVEKTHPEEALYIYKCPHCSKKFKTESDLDKHRLSHAAVHTRKVITYTCLICDKKYSTKRSLSSHTRTHTAERKYECSYCDKKFPDNCNLSNHIRTHTGETPFACSFCDKKFKIKSNLTQHVRFTHTKEGLDVHECPHCSKKMFHKKNLVKHMRTHTKEKPFECLLCDKKYTRNSILAEHIRKNHQETI